MWRAQQRRGGVSPVVDVRLERVVLNLVRKDVIETSRHERREIEGFASLDFVGRRSLHRRWNLLDR
jgi:hypothetical protein